MDKQKPSKMIERRENGTKRVATVPVGESRTQQQYKDQVNVNNIIAKFKKTGTVTHIRNAAEGVYADLTDLPSLMEAEQVVIAARNAFAAVPSEIRARFGHDPQNFIDFLSDKKNDEEAVKLGLKVRPTPPKPDPVVEEIKTLGKTLAQKLTPKKRTTES